MGVGCWYISHIKLHVHVCDISYQVLLLCYHDYSNLWKLTTREIHCNEWNK
jgi:hypothetical protein